MKSFLIQQKLDLNNINDIIVQYNEYITIPFQFKNNNNQILDSIMNTIENSYKNTSSTSTTPSANTNILTTAIMSDHVFINLQLPASNGDIKRVGLTTSLPISDLVSKVFQFMRVKLKQLNQLVVNEDECHRQVFKVVGQNEYLLHTHFPLYMYDCFLKSVRLKVSISVY